jgi:HAE1 family hydrophobic/amphiphilic exporter-1
VLVLTVVLFIVVPKGFIRIRDTDQIAITTESAQGTSYDNAVKYQTQVSNIIRENPNVVALVSTIGGAAANTLGAPNLGQLVVTLKPRDERSASVNDVIEQLRPELARVPGMEVFMQNPPTIRIGGQVSKSPYQFSLQSADSQQLYATTRTLLKRFEDVPGIQDLTSDLEISSRR